VTTPGVSPKLSTRNTARRLAWRYLPERVLRAGRELRGPNGAAPGTAPAAASPGRPKAARAPAPHRESLLRALERGWRLDDSVISQIRSLIGAAEADEARAIAESLREHPETRTLGHVASGIVAYRQGFVELAWAEFQHVPREAWIRLATVEYVRSGLAVAPDDALREIRQLVADDPADAPAKSWFEVLTAVFGFGEHDLARAVYAIFDRHVDEDPTQWRHAELQRDWLRPWVAADAGSPTAPSPPEGRRSFAIMDYGHPAPFIASANIGDHVQSLASLGHLVRHRGVRWHGPEDLVDLLNELGGRTRPEMQRDGIDADVQVRTVHRDASMYEAIPEDTWVLCFGWYMHAIFKMRHGFPLHRNLRPIFISFHCNKRGLLTPDAVEYLKRYGPVGCRDWTTVYLLLSLGVPAFFSGCLTTSISTVFPDLATEPGAEAPIAYVDVPAAQVPADGVTYQHSDRAVRRRSFVANVSQALDLLETYRSRHRGVVTSRLHCYLPVRSLGMDVDFRPKNHSDVRFDGLIDIDDAAFGAIREGLTGKLEQVLAAILSGRPEADVYALWREITAPDVAAAEEQRMREVGLRPVAADVGVQVQRAVSETVTYERTAAAPPGDEVDCAVLAPKQADASLSVLVESLHEHASRPLHLWILVAGGPEAVVQGLAERFPQITFSRVPIAGLGHGLRSRPSAAQVARVSLADLLGDVRRLVVLPLPSVVTADIAELAGLDLGGHALAAPMRPGRTDVSGFGVIHAAAARLGRRTESASALRRTAHARHAFDFQAFNADVLVLDGARLREDRLGDQALRLVEEFGLDDVEALHYLVGPDRAEVPGRWAVVPSRTPERGPGLIHWADRVKPWQQMLTPERERWRAYAAAVESQSRPA
jgi:uncharacterized Zn-binding protein involved in type VI secretion